MPENDSGFPGLTSKLGIAFHDRYVESCDPADLENAIDAFDRAVKRMSTDSPHLVARLNSLAAGLKDHHVLFGDASDFAAAVNALRKAAQLGTDATAEEDLRSAKNWMD
jgi:hypothetical protein